MIPKYKDLYKYLQESGFTLVFKEVVYDGEGKAKGNCDADLVLQEKNKLKVILSPSIPKRCSILLKRINAPITYLEGVKDKIFLNKKEKALAKD